VSEYPRKKQFAESLAEALDGRRREQTMSGPMGIFVRQATQELQSLSRLNDPRGLYLRLPFELGLN
jgi:protease-4